MPILSLRLKNEKPRESAMAESRQDYEMLKELLKDGDFRKLTGKVLGMMTRLDGTATP